MARQGAWYYVVITGDAGKPNTFLPMKRSKDLVHWTELGPVFTALPTWVQKTLGVAPHDLWAPDLTYVNGEWRLYYAASQFGTTNSGIALATTKSLDPASKDHHWVDHGVVLRSLPGATGPQAFNAIDPDLSIDAQGRQWLSFGSFWSGIKMRRINPATGQLSTQDRHLYALATRQAPDAMEGPSIARHGKYYYLFVSWDFCCRGVNSDYREMVGRATKITGPYVDRAGVPMLKGGGTEVMRGYNEFIGTGGADVYSHGGRHYLVNHYYDATDNGTPRLNVRRLSWAHGWPKVSDPVNPSRWIGHGDAYVKIIPRGGRTVVEDNGCGYEGANIGLWTDLGNTCQQWQISLQGKGSRILNHFSNKVADIQDCGKQGTNVFQWGWVGFLPNNDCQRWSFAPAADGYSTIATLRADRGLWTAVGGTTTAGTNIALTAPAATASSAQQFRFSPVGKVLLASSTNRRQTLGVVGCRASTGNGRRVRLQARSTRRCQEWRFHHIAGSAATYTVTNVASGLELAARRDGSGQLRLVRPRPRNLDRRTWTLRPTNSGTWTLATNGATRAFKLLLP